MFGSDNSRPLLLPIVYDLANLIREGFLRSDKYHEHERENRHQFLRRSFETQQQQPRLNGTIKEIDFGSPINYLRDDTLNVEMSEPIVKSIEKRSDDSSNKIIRAEPLTQILNKNLTKINASIQSTLTRSSSLPSLNEISKTTNLSMEEIENLALKDLNGTLLVEEGIKDVNGSEISPMALVSRHKKRPPYQQNNSNKRIPGPLPETCERFTGI